MIKSIIKLIVYKIRIFNVEWNPFFSPSLYFLEATKHWGKNFMKGLTEGMSEKKLDKGYEIPPDVECHVWLPIPQIVCDDCRYPCLCKKHLESGTVFVECSNCTKQWFSDENGKLTSSKPER